MWADSIIPSAKQVAIYVVPFPLHCRLSFHEIARPCQWRLKLVRADDCASIAASRNEFARCLANRLLCLAVEIG
jgi:hypothetical protein